MAEALRCESPGGCRGGCARHADCRTGMVASLALASERGSRRARFLTTYAASGCRDGGEWMGPNDTLSRTFPLEPESRIFPVSPGGGLEVSEVVAGIDAEPGRSSCACRRSSRPAVQAPPDRPKSWSAGSAVVACGSNGVARWRSSGCPTSPAHPRATRGGSRTPVCDAVQQLLQDSARPSSSRQAHDAGGQRRGRRFLPLTGLTRTSGCCTAGSARSRSAQGAGADLSRDQGVVDDDCGLHRRFKPPRSEG